MHIYNIMMLNSNLNGYKIDKDADGNVGYIAPGADSVTPFKRYKLIAESISGKMIFIVLDRPVRLAVYLLPN